MVLSQGQKKNITKKNNMDLLFICVKFKFIILLHEKKQCITYQVKVMVKVAVIINNYICCSITNHQFPVSFSLIRHTHSRTTVVGWWVVVTSTNLGQIYNSTIESQRTQTTITIPGQCPNSCIILQDSYGVQSPKVKSKTIKRSLRRTYKQRRSRCASESVFLSIEYVNRILAHKAARTKANL